MEVNMCTKLLLFIVLSAVTIQAATIPTSQEDIELLKEALLIIKSSYVRANLNDKELIHGAIGGVVDSLNDPYTSFLSTDDFKELTDETSGQFGGVGIIVTLKNQKVTVISPIYDSPADRAGIRAGDVIFRVNSTDIDDGELNKALKLLKGEIGQTVEIEVMRPRGNTTHKFLFRRELVKNSSIIYSGMTESGIGYIRVRNFSSSTEQDIAKELRKMQKSNLRGLVLDLRSNAGGLLSAGINTANLFLDSGTILSTRSRDGDKNIYLADAQVHFKNFPIVVLIDGGTASAAEIVAAALKDNQRALLVGQKSFGKGCVQTVKPLSDGTAISLTTAWYYTPSGKCIHDQGIDPDIIVESPLIDDQKAADSMMGTLRQDQESSYQDRYEGKVHHLVPPDFDLQLIRGIEALDEFWKFHGMYEKIGSADNN